MWGHGSGNNLERDEDIRVAAVAEINGEKVFALGFSRGSSCERMG